MADFIDGLDLDRPSDRSGGLAQPASVGLPTQETDEQRIRREAGLTEEGAPSEGPKLRADTSELSLGDAWEAATEEEWLWSGFLQENRLSSIDPEEGWEWNDDTIKRFITDEKIPEESYDYVLKARSSTEARRRVNHVRDSLLRQRELASKGWTGTALSFAAAMSDPATLPLAVAPGGILTKGGRIARFLKGGAAASAGVGITEGIAEADSIRPTGSSKDVLFQSVAAFALGGGLNALGRTVHDAPSTRGRVEEDASALERERLHRTIDDSLVASDTARSADVDADDVAQALREWREKNSPAPETRATQEAPAPKRTANQAKSLAAADRKALIKEFGLSPKKAKLEDPNVISKLSDEDLSTRLDTAKQELDPLQGQAKQQQVEARIKQLENEAARRKPAAAPEETPKAAPEVTPRETSNTREGDAWVAKRAREIAQARKPVQQEVADLGDDPDLVQVGADSVGAARVVGYSKPLTSDLDDALKQSQDAPYSASTHLGGIPIRYDSVGRLGSSGLTQSRRWGFKLGQEAVGARDGSVLEAAATEIQAKLAKTKEIEMWRGVLPAFRQWAKEKGYGVLKRHSPYHQQDLMEKFGQELDEYIRFGRTESESVKQAGDTLRRLYGDYVDLVNESGVKGFGGLEKNPNYAPRLMSTRAWRENIQKLGADQVMRLFANALRRAQPGLDEDKAVRIAEAIVRKVREDQAGMEVRNSALLTGDNLDELEQILEHADVDQDTIGEFLDHLKAQKAKQRDGQGHSRSRHRALFDEDFTMELKNTSTYEMEKVRIIDLYERDAVHGFLLYNRQISGQVALARHGIKSEADFEVIKRNILAEADEKGGGEFKKRAKEDIKNLDYLYKNVAGIPFEDVDSLLYRGGRRLMEYNFIRLMGQAGFAQISELGNAIAEVGLGTMLRSMPSLKSLLRNARTGKLNDELLDEMELLTGLGGDLIRGQPVHRIDEYGLAYGMSGDSRLAKFTDRTDRFLGAGKRIVHMASMGPANVTLHRWAGRAMAQRFFDMAHGASAGPFKSMLRRSGLTEGELGRVFEQIRRHSSQVEGSRKIRKLNTDQWDDHGLAEKFGSALFRIQTMIISEPDPGNLPAFTSKTLGRIFAQFRTFTLMSHSKHFLRIANRVVNEKDWYAANVMLASTVTGTMAYVAQTYLQALGKDDPQGYLDYRLSNESIATAAIQRSSWAALMPMIIDTLAWDGKVFNARTTGQASDLLFGNPTADLISSVSSAAAGGMGTAFDPDHEFSRDDYRNLRRSLAFQRMLGVDNILREIEEDLPEPR